MPTKGPATYPTSHGEEKPPRPPLSSVVLAARKARGWSQQRFAEKAGVSQAAVSLWESGGGVKAENVNGLARVLGVDVEDVLRWM